MRRSKILIIAVPLTLILFCFVLYEYVFLEIRSEKASAEESHAVKKKSLEKYLAFIAEKQQFEKRLAVLQEIRKTDNGKIIEGQTISLSSAALQDMVKGIITGKGGTISSERIEKPEEFDGFKIISVSIDTIMPDTGSLSEALFSIETQTPFLVIKEIDTRVRNFREPKDLLVKLKISAITAAR